MEYCDIKCVDCGERECAHTCPTCEDNYCSGCYDKDLDKCRLCKFDEDQEPSEEDTEEDDS